MLWMFSTLRVIFIFSAIASQLAGFMCYLYIACLFCCSNYAIYHPRSGVLGLIVSVAVRMKA